MKTKVLIGLIILSLLGGSMSFSAAAAQGDWGAENRDLGIAEVRQHEDEAAAWDYALPREEHLRSKEQSGFDCSTVTIAPYNYLKSECEVLVALYQSTDGTNWIRNNNWLSNPDLETWHGLSFKDLSDKKVVRTMGLSINQLNGSIPPELGDLTELRHLYLDGNQLSGNIPVELGNLTYLESLYLNNNQLSGNIPVELGNLTNLEYLNLYTNHLSGRIPAELGNLTNLRTLNLFLNQLSGNIPAELGNLTNLEV
ncbi:MAG: hypothetical protein GX638_19620, partial [Crenarchaeota archaeon]|nr:hypothetical protein [Thermoproteota archaeon]